MNNPIRQQPIYGKIPPQAPELEEIVLGAIILESKCIELVCEIITTPDVFYKDLNRIIFKTILELRSKNVQVDMMTILEQLKKNNELELIGGNYYLIQLTMNVVSSANIESHCRILMEKYFGREMIRIGSKAVSDTYAGSTDSVFDIIEAAEKEIYDLTANNIGKPVEHISQEVIAISEEIAYKIEHQITFSGVPTGFKNVDNLTGGWQNTDLIILAARTSIGKTALALNLAYNAASDKEKQSGVAFFSLEMSRKQLTERLLSLSSGVELNRIKKPLLLDQSDFVKMSDANIELMKTPIYIDDTPAISVAQVVAKIRRLIKKHSIKLAIIDYIQLMDGSRTHKGNREQEVAGISRDLKKAAMNLDIPIIALSQLNRKVEYRDGRKPTIADLRESGGIENDANVIILCFNATDDDIAENPELKNMIFADFAKNRNGSLDEIPLYKNLSIQKFQDNQFYSEVPVPQFDNSSTGIRKQFPPNNINYEDQSPF